MKAPISKTTYLFATGILLTLLVPFLLIYIATQYNLSKYSTEINPTDEFCIEGYFLLPNHYHVQTDIEGTVSFDQTTTILGRYDIFAKKLCIKPNDLLKENTTYNVNGGYINIGILQKQIETITGTLPEVRTGISKTEINTNEVLTFEMSYIDDKLGYYIQSDEEDILCEKDTTLIYCDISYFDFPQGSSHTLSLISKYNDELISTLETKAVSILDAIEVIESSIENNEVLLNPDTPSIKLILNKYIEENFDITLEDSNGNTISQESSIDEKIITVKIENELKQNMSYVLSLSNVLGTDGSTLEEEYILKFSVDNGPKVSYTNLSNTFSQSNNLVITFNQSLANQNVKSYVKLAGGTDYSYYISGSQIVINPNSNLSFCTSYKLDISKGIASVYGLTSTQSYSYSLKTTCKRTSSIGTSVDGRGIYAYYFGSGSKKIIFFAAMHGSEANTKYALYKLVSDLESNFSSIPSDKTVIVVPALNPDGIANSTRFNSNGVDINRNFDSSTWTSGTYFLSQYYATGGGDEPFSEPETRAIRDLILRESPYLTISYHSAAGYVIPTNSSYAISLAHTYSSLSGYSYVAPGADGAFSYDVTGSFAEWAEAHGYNALVVELSSAYYDQYSLNDDAMWEMIKK